jgi:hypothetical protein
MTKYAVWKIGSREETKEYVYANSHREAATKYRAKYPKLSSEQVETQKT